jgi:NAD(P)-dependent dehydrogenase (short-subunit alcohol dehydrogenase family)
LLNRILVNAPARIINVSSGAHFLAGLDFNDLQCEEKYSALDAYNRSKLAVILFTRALARRLRVARVTANCLDPGMAATHIHDSIGGPVRDKIEQAKAQFGVIAAEAAETVIYLASSSEVDTVSGEYFVNCGIARPSTAACDDASAEQLCAVSRKLTGTNRDHPAFFPDLEVGG